MYKRQICTSDLHIRSGAVPRARPGVVLGHEFVGVVEAVGNGISNLRPGGRVAACCESFCGECWFCRRGYVNNCVQGGWELGSRIDGCQAEYVRVPFADTGLTPVSYTHLDVYKRQGYIFYCGTVFNGLCRPSCALARFMIR